MNKKVLVTVAANSGGGKSTITSLVKKSLEEAGIDVQYNPNAFDTLPDTELTRVRLEALKENGLSVEILEQQMNRAAFDDNGANERIDAVFNSIAAVHSYFGYVENWVSIPLEDTRECYWLVDEEAGIVKFADTVELLLNSDGEYYKDEIYTQRFLHKYVYRADDFTMISVDTHTDGNKFLRIFDNKKEVEVKVEQQRI